MLKKILKEATRIEQWQQEIYTTLHNINAEWITNGRLNISRLPTSSEANRFLVVRTANADPVYDVIVADDIPSISRSKISDFWDTPFWGNIPDKPSTFPPSTHASTHASGGSDPVSLDASQITSGRLSLSRLPTSATANRFLVVRTANADPVYDAIAAADIPGLDASKIVSGRFSVSRLPDGSSGYVLVGQGSGYDMAWRDISGIAGTITDSQHGTKTGIPFAHHGDWAHYGKIPTSAPTGAAERAYVDSANLYVHDGTSWVLRATKDWNNLINKPSTFPPSAHASSHEYGGTDLVRNLDYLAIRGTTVITSGMALQNIASVAQTLLPDADNTRALGSSSYRWSDVRTALLNGWNPDAHKSRHESGGADAITGWISPSYIGPRSDSATYLWFRTKNIAGTSAVDHRFCPTDGYYGLLGTSTYYWYEVYARNVNSTNVYPKDGDNTGYLGDSTLRWAYLYAVNKSAAFKHPLHNPERYIVFKCVESPKVTVEDWGIAELKDGKAFVGLSEEFVALMSDKTEYAVFLTPEGECNGLYVSKKEFYGFEVRELNNGKSNIRFSWQVKAVRIGDEETPVLEEPTPQFTDQEKDKQLEWTKNKQEADKKKEEDRLNRMKQKIAKYREATSQT